MDVTNKPRFPLNPAFHAAVLDARADIVRQFKAVGADPNSETFLARFPFVFVEEVGGDPTLTSARQRLIAAAFSDEFRSRTQEAIDIFYANHSGGTPEYYLLDLVDDFLNHSLPRSFGLADEDALFDGMYRQFEADLFTDSYTLNVVSLLRNASDHGGRFHPTCGLSFAYADSSPRIVLNHPHLRNRAISFLEIQKSARPLYGGEDISKGTGFFVLQFEEARRKKKGGLGEAHRRAEEITKKTILALRLITSTPAYTEYRGFRALGHYAGGSGGMVLMNYPGERIDKGFGLDSVAWAQALERLFPSLLSASTESITVIYDKIDDALRRQQQRGGSFDGTAAKPAIDQLLDYFQALEAIVPVEGSYRIALSVAVLLQAASKGRRVRAVEVFDFVKDMHKLRNEVVHGRIDNVLLGKANTKFKIADIGQFRQYVHELAILYLLNPDEKGKYGLRKIAERLALGEDIDLKTLYGPDPP
jgi:hypothetical protein